MILISADSVQSRVWADPMLDQQLDGVRETIESLSDTPDRVDQQTAHTIRQSAETLCESTRELVYRLHRITPEQASSIKSVFSRAVSSLESKKDRLDEAGYHEVADTIDQFRRHINRRLIMIDELLG